MLHTLQFGNPAVEAAQLGMADNTLPMQAFGMMGWRLGYIAYPATELAANSELGFQMAKVQDTIPICVTQMSQVAALGALEAGSPWVRQQVQGLASNRWGCSDKIHFAVLLVFVASKQTRLPSPVQLVHFTCCYCN